MPRPYPRGAAAVALNAWHQAIDALCNKCGPGEQPELLPGTSYFYHANPLMQCPASKLWARMGELGLLTPRR